MELDLVDGDRVITFVPASDWGVESFDLGSPEIRERVTPQPNADGTIDQTAHIGARLVTLSGVEYVGDALADAEDALKWFCHPGRRPVLRWKHDGQDRRQVTLRADAYSAPIVAPREGVLRAQVSWRVPSGVVFAAEQSKVEAYPDTDEAGRSYDLVFDRTYPFSSGTSVQVENVGNLDTHPVLRAYGPMVDPRFENVTTGERLEFTARGGLQVPAGSYLEVDCGARTALLNSDAVDGNRLRHLNYADPARSTWIRFAPGVNLFRFYPGSFSGATKTIVTWRSAWL